MFWMGMSMRTDDLSYFRGRAAQEQVAAQNATCQEARMSHEQLAAMYCFRAAMLSSPVNSWCHALSETRSIETTDL
jgi:hypothetical protein